MRLKFWKRFRLKKIRTRFLLAMLLLVTVSIPALGYTSYVISAAIIENNHAASYLSSLETSNEVVNNTLENIVNSTRTFLYDQEFLQMVDRVPDENFTLMDKLGRDNLINQDVKRFTFYIGDIAWACFYDKTGAQYSHGSRKNMLSVALGSTYEKVKQTEWFRQIEEAEGREVFFSYDVLDRDNPDGLFTCGKVINRTDTYEPLGVLLVFIKKSIFRSAFPSRPGGLEDCYLIADMESGKVRNLLYATNREFDERFEDDEIGVIGNRFLEMIAENYRLHEKMSELQLKQKEAELKRLQAEINPHFLYNTLDSIYWMAAMKNVPEIGRMAVALSRVFRISLNGGGEDTTVRQELEQVENYMVIQSMRFQNRIKYSIRADESILDCTIIKIILQPFVENAVLHGLEPRTEEGNLVVRGIDEGEYLRFIIEDDGMGMDLETAVPAGYGIQNVLDRVELYYGGRGRIGFESRPARGTRVTIRIPKEREKGEKPC